MKKSISLLVTGMLAVSALGACSKGDNASEANGKVKIEFFEYKSEAKGTFEELAKKFEKENPNIDVVVSNPPDATTVLRTRVAKRDLPDVIGMGGDISYADMAKAGAFQDMTNNKQLNDVQPAYTDMLKSISGLNKVYGIPYAANADAVIYNKAIFKELGLEIPKTWDEFMAVAEKVKAAGKIPFYFTFKDSWTTLPAYNALAANTQGADFFKQAAEGKATFTDKYKVATDKFLQLLQYGHKDQTGKAYADGNVAFANGQSAMYLQGIWAIPEIKKANPNIDLGVFPYPVTNNPAETKVVSGVDLLLTVGKTTKHPKEAEKFVEFLLANENLQTYMKEQNAFPTKKGMTQDDPALEGLKENFTKGAVVDFVDHYVPSAVGLDGQLQKLTQTKDEKQFLTTLDQEWNKVQNRK